MSRSGHASPFLALSCASPSATDSTGHESELRWARDRSMHTQCIVQDSQRCSCALGTCGAFERRQDDLVREPTAGDFGKKKLSKSIRFQAASSGCCD